MRGKIIHIKILSRPQNSSILISRLSNYIKTEGFFDTLKITTDPVATPVATL